MKTRAVAVVDLNRELPKCTILMISTVLTSSNLRVLLPTPSFNVPITLYLYHVSLIEMKRRKGSNF
jgi:hypothetical protein